MIAFHLCEVSRQVKFIDTERRWWLPFGGREVENEGIGEVSAVRILQDKDGFGDRCGNGCTMV
jgi:hypothetical protein